MAEFNGLPQGGSPQIERFRQVIRRLTTTALDLVFPPQCIGCKRHVGSLLCAECQAALTPSPLIREMDDPLQERQATALYGGALQSAIHGLKYRGKSAFAAILAKRLADTFAQTDWTPTVLTAVPLHANRQKNRGFNQSALLATELSKLVQIPFNPQLVKRIKDTRPQVGLGIHDRQQNMESAFQADPTLCKDQQIVIVDDVYTTGATIRACASALLEAGASKVWALTVASAGRTDRELNQA
jgi:competence protein ComFC